MNSLLHLGGSHCDGNSIDTNFFDIRLERPLATLKHNLDAPADLDPASRSAGSSRLLLSVASDRFIDLTLTLATCRNFHSADACQVLTPYKEELDATLRQVDKDLTGTIFTFFVCSSSCMKSCLWGLEKN